MSTQPDPSQATTKNVLLVGDRFLGFAGLHPRVQTMTDVLATRGEGVETIYRVGQGLTQEQRQEVARFVASSSAATVVGFPERASREETHKHEVKNILISSPRKLGPDEFELDLLVDGRSAELSDHQTGQHIQGMALLEAARQSILAVTEHYYIPRGESGDYVFILSELSVAFQRFAFPLPAVLRYSVDEASLGDRDRMRFDVSIAIRQADQDAAQLRFSFAVFRRGPLLRKEHAKAEQALAAFFRQVEADRPVASADLAGRTEVQR
ncbi:MAG: AfsA-related hotdog domain-containing protein [Planctomycetota bacterium]